MEALYESVRSWVREEDDNISFPSWKGVDEYRDPVDPTSLSAKFMAVFPEVASLLNSCVEWKVILDDITQDKNKVLGYGSKKNFKLCRLERSMKESVSTFQSVVEAEQQNGGPQQKQPLSEN